MPRPVSSHATYLPGLDGLRAIAVVAVVAYHLDVPGMSGGLLGVGMFFTLSGYLITTILLRTWERTQGLDLRTFWLRRARRLLPAVILLLVAVLLATLAVSPTDLGVRSRESVAAMLYVSNWTTIAADLSYFDRFATPGPLDHLWSLAVEEQFYIFWPPLLLVMLRAFKGRMSRVAALTLAIAIASFVLMAVVAQPGFDNTRAYEGTDTRAGGLLLGAVFAMVWRPDRLTAQVTDGARAVLDGLGVVALAVILWLFTTLNPFSLALYTWGLLTLSLATSVLVSVVVHPASRLGRVLGVAPLVWLGERSYGIYLWHLPIFAFTPATVLPDSPVLRGGLQVAVTLVVSGLSWTLLEDPIRRHGLRGALQRGRDATLAIPGSDREHRIPRLASATAGVVALGTMVLVAPAVLAGTARQPTDPVPVAAGVDDDATPIATPTPSTSPTPGGQDATPAPTTSTTTPTASPTPTPASPDTPMTSCDAVVHIGDSTSRGLNNENQLPEADQRLDARYAAVGVETFVDEISPARSIVETYEDNPNANTVVETRLADGYDGCWVFALGTADAANVSVGGTPGIEERIDRLMGQVGDTPVLWVNGKALEQDGPYSDPEITKWNAALLAACDRYPSMRVYDWRSEVQDEWYDPDGIHFIAIGDRQRADRIATALATAFPDVGDTPEGCLVTSWGDPDERVEAAAG